MNNKPIKILILSFLILSSFPASAQAAGSATVAITVTISEAEIIEADVWFRPEVIRPRTRGLRCYIELGEPYKIGDIDTETVALVEVNGSAIAHPLQTSTRPRIGDDDKDGISDLMVRFNIRNIIRLLEIGENSLTVAGKMTDGHSFKGIGTIRFK